MLNDSYAECLVKKRTPGYSGLLTALLALGVLLSAGSILLFRLFGFIAFLLMYLTAVYVHRLRRVEYEYLFAEGQFTVDVILNKSRRKKMAEYDLENIQIVAPVHSNKLQEFERKVKTIEDFSSGNADAKRYAMICQKDGSCKKVLFEPDERMLRCIRMAAPGKYYSSLRDQ